MKGILHEAIDGTQLAFVNDRNIMDCIMIANESVEDNVHCKKKGLILKLDLEKASDYTNWEFLDYIMVRKGFRSKWRKRIYGCPQSSNFSILINGSAKGFFPASGGLRQVDPLSRFLFTLVADAFSQILKNGDNRNFIQGFQASKESIPLSHLQYADDTLFFLDGERSNLLNLIALIHCFELVSGMKINWKKSCLVGVNSNIDGYKGIAEGLECQISALPIDYLGVLLSGNPRSREFYPRL